MLENRVRILPGESCWHYGVLYDGVLYENKLLNQQLAWLTASFTAEHLVCLCNNHQFQKIADA